MNTYLIHGDNNIASYERLQTYIKKASEKGFEIINIENKEKKIIDILRSVGLFNNKRLIVIRNYTLIDITTLKYLGGVNHNLQIIIYHDATIPITFIKKLGNVKKNEIFQLSKYLWKFIDSFYPENTLNCLTFFHETLKTEPVELVFSILVGQLRDIFIMLYSKKPLSYPPWRLQKLRSLSDKFGRKKINKVIDQLSEIDVKVKTTGADLKDELDLFIIRKLE